MNVNDKRIKKQKIRSAVVSLIIGVAIGATLALWGINGEDPLRDYLRVVYALLAFYLFSVVQLIVHEGGHLLFGLLAGYRFGSFRIFSIIFFWTDGKLALKRFRLGGTAGQCLMRSPEKPIDKRGVAIYNLGGVLLNLLTLPFLLALFALAVCLGAPYMLSVLPLSAALAGLLTALSNGIPLRTGMVDNDGYNTYAATRDEEALRAFDLQLKITERMLQGQRMKDMPEEWFVLPADEAMKNSMRATEGVLFVNRLIDMRSFDRAKALTDRLLSLESGIIGLHLEQLKMERLYMELITEGRKEVIEGLYTTKDLQKTLAAMKGTLTAQRTAYAYALLYKKDTAEAEKWSALFEKTAAAYPYPSEAEAERELLALAKERAADA